MVDTGFRILAIETSCDETAAAVVAEGRVLSNVIASQAEHQQWGGIVPELASRAHLERIVGVTMRALEVAALSIRDIDAIACTVKPGLVGSLLVGANFAKGIAVRYRLPCVPVHHLEGHLYSGYLANPELPLPAVVLVASGGHTLLFLLERMDRYRLLGSTRDDAAGETFDKIATLLGLPYPGGPAIEQIARTAEPSIPFPRPLLKDGTYEFSFSGLKTAVRRYVAEQGQLSDDQRAAIAASVQAAIVEVLVTKTLRAAKEFRAPCVVVAGGVAANSLLQQQLRAAAAEHGIVVAIPERQYLLDNAAMIGLVAHFKVQLHGVDRYRRLDFTVDPTPWRIHRHGIAKHRPYTTVEFSL